MGKDAGKKRKESKYTLIGVCGGGGGKREEQRCSHQMDSTTSVKHGIFYEWWKKEEGWEIVEKSCQSDKANIHPIF